MECPVWMWTMNGGGSGRNLAWRTRGKLHSASFTPVMPHRNAVWHDTCFTAQNTWHASIHGMPVYMVMPRFNLNSLPAGRAHTFGHSKTPFQSIDSTGRPGRNES